MPDGSVVFAARQKQVPAKTGTNRLKRFGVPPPAVCPISICRQLAVELFAAISDVARQEIQQQFPAPRRCYN